MALPKEERLKEKKKFSALFSEGKSIANKILVLYYKPMEDETREAGFTVGKKIGGAVVRNKYKRRMKAVYRSLLTDVKRGYLLLFIARNGILQANSDQIKKSQKDLLQKAGIWKKKENS